MKLSHKAVEQMSRMSTELRLFILMTFLRVLTI